MEIDHECEQALRPMLPDTLEKLKKCYVADLHEWMAANRRNVERWTRMTKEEKQRVADLYKEGKGLYTFESCVKGVPEYTFPMCGQIMV